MRRDSMNLLVGVFALLLSNKEGICAKCNLQDGTVGLEMIASSTNPAIHTVLESTYTANSC